ncbi:hypothetical protein HIM_11842 [Hirsutella minnesotensis 3608]|uniref:Uncharacterized protein n=1 Tax=Hirsutella minnesotensis 3608 TaxID=1043627 RepID=A0A0F7ZR05_9HYPO|nr:hypothetical protein HIM_11842 [Hirsutella minnesotensis 3608]
MQPIVSFTGPVIGSGRDLLRGNSAPALDDPQLTCCGFVQLSTFICPGMPGKTPFKGFHPFQVFVIFPIHANPWTSLRKKMTERRDSQFQPDAFFTFTGKIAGLLDHQIMTHAPAFEQYLHRRPRYVDFPRQGHVEPGFCDTATADDTQGHGRQSLRLWRCVGQVYLYQKTQGRPKRRLPHAACI